MSSELPKHGSLRALRDHYTRLAAPPPDALVGRFRATFIGPLWLRLTARPGLALGGLRGFWGKELHGPGVARNLLARREGIVTGLPMNLAAARSVIDGAPCFELTYPPGSPFPFERVRDELRVVDGATLMGMTFVDAPIARTLGLPFLLERDA